MTATKHRFIPALLIASIFLVSNLATTATAQSVWVTESQASAMSLQILKPDFKGEDPYTLPTSVWIATYRLDLKKNLVSVVELPFAHTGLDSAATFKYLGIFPNRETIIGNVYIGVELFRPNSRFSAEVGVRPPTANDDNSLARRFGIASDFNRFETFWPDLLSVSSMVNYRSIWRGTRFRLRAGPNLIVPTEGNLDSELFIDYSAMLWTTKKRFEFGAGVSGRLLATDDRPNIGQRSTHDLGLFTSHRVGSLKPGLHWRLPLDRDLRRLLNSVVSLNVVAFFD